MLTVTRQGLVASAAVTADRQEAIQDVRPLMTRKLAWSCRAAGRLAAIRPGVYEALASSEYLPDWVAGISIGAINAAIIAGNSPENRLKRLRTFWNEITAHTSLWPCALDSSLGIWQQKMGALTALMFGQPGFSRRVHGWTGLPRQSRQLLRHLRSQGTLERLVDFDRINNAGARD